MARTPLAAAPWQHRPYCALPNPNHMPSPWCLPCLQAVSRSPGLQEILKRTRCSSEYLWRACKRSDPALQFKKESVKPAFTDEEMQERVDFCYKMLNEPPEWLHGIVYMDESSVPLSPRPVLVIGRKGQEALAVDARIRKDKRQIEYIHYMLSVCWATGLVKLDILSFTKGYDDPVQYKASVPLHPAAHPCLPVCCPAHLERCATLVLVITGSIEE